MLGAAIDKYVYITLNRRPLDTRLWISYSKVEVVGRVEEIQHGLVREAFQLLNIRQSVEVHSIAEVVGGTGMGSSASFTVGLLNALHVLSRRPATARELAEEAFESEVTGLGHPSGKQDQYLAAFGGLTCLFIEPDGEVRVEPLTLAEETLEDLESNLLLFYTGIQRPSEEILAEQSIGAAQQAGVVVESMHEIKRIGLESRDTLLRGDLQRFGQLLDEHWQYKRRVASQMSSGWIDDCYDEARDAGVLGGKIIGAGGGGFFLFYCDAPKRELRERMAKRGLKELPFRFDFHGTQLIGNFGRQ